MANKTDWTNTTNTIGSNRFLLVAVVALFYLLTPLGGLAYNDQTTHPALTDEIVDFYNLVFSNNQITAEEKEWIISGSIAEDTSLRMMNHFYDPTTGQGWTGELAGNISAEAVKTITEKGTWFEPRPATDWAVNYLAQQEYFFYGGNHSWKQGLDEYAEDKRKEAFITLGHVLHLLEDMGVPDHTRGDTHMDAVSGITGDKGSPYEQYASRWNRTTIKGIGLTEKVVATGYRPLPKPRIEDYLKSMAEYSNKYFFSKDTIGDFKYASPTVAWEEGDFGYGVDERGNNFMLVVVDKILQRGEEKTIYSLKNKVEYDPVFDAYFARLARQILVHGAGVIDLFLKQGEDAKTNLEFQKASNPLYFAFIKPTGDAATAAKFSPAGFFSNLSSAISSAADSVKNIASRGLGFVTGLVGRDSAPAGVDAGLPQPDNGEKLVLESTERAGQNLDPTVTFQPQEAAIQTAAAAQPSAPTESQSSVSIPAATERQPGGQEDGNGAPTRESGVPAPIFPPGGGGGSGPSSGATAVIPPPDSSPPDAVADLMVGGIASSSLVLRWTAPADSGTSAASYEIVFATTTITEDSWANGRTVASPAPLPPGASQEVSVSGLESSTTYYFAVRSRDSAANESAISNIASATTLSASAVSNVNHALISEVQVSGVDDGDEFIELYNPTGGQIDLSGWSIQYLSGNATSALQVQKKNFENDSAISSLGYFLIARDTDIGGGDGYVGSSTPDMIHRTFGLFADPAGATIFLVADQEEITGADDVSIIDRVSYGIGTGFLPEGTPAALPPAGQSIERLAWVEDACATAAGANEFSGNGCDRQDNTNDFELRAPAGPQNTASLPETRSAPTIRGFLAAYSSSTMTADFLWLPSEDGQGVTSTNSYAISIINATSSPTALWQGTSTSFSAEIFEETSYLFEVQDRDGMSAEASTTITAPFFSYRGVIFEQVSTSTSHEIGGQSGSHYWAQSFKPQRTGRVESVSIQLVGSGGRLDGIADCTLKIYKTDSPHTTSTANLVGSAYEISQGEVMHGSRCVLGNSLSTGKFDFATSTVEAGERYILVYSYSDATHYPQLLGGADEINGQYWVDGNPYPQKDAALGLEGIVMSPPMNPEPPTAPANLQTSFNAANLLLSVSWDISSDPDSPADEVVYQVNITTSTELAVSGWSPVSSSTLATTTVNFPDTYLIGVRAADEFRDLSPVATSSWYFPAGFSVSEDIVSQTDTNAGDIGANSQDGSKTNQYGQTFAVSSSSFPYSIILNTAGTQSGYCDVKIYSADTIDNANSGNLVAQSETIFGSGCNAADGKTFEFVSTGELLPGTTYIWIYTARNGVGFSDGIIGGYKADGYPGAFFKKRNDGVAGTTSGPDVTHAAYFRLLGNVE